MKNFILTEEEKKSILKMHYGLFEQVQNTENLYGTSRDPNYQKFYECLKKTLPNYVSKITQSKDGKLYELKTLNQNGAVRIFRSDNNVYDESGKVVGEFHCEGRNKSPQSSGQQSSGQQSSGQQSSGQQNSTEIKFTPAQQSALNYVAKQGFVRMNPEPDEFRVEQGEFVKLDLTVPDKNYPDIFIENVIKQFPRDKFPNGVNVYGKGSTVQGASAPVKIQVEREQCRTAVFAIYEELTDPENTELERQQQTEHFNTIRKCLGKSNKLGMFNVEYNSKLNYILKKFPRLKTRR